MLKLDSDSGAPLHITQINTDFSVYLDHWALRKVSADDSLAKRFRNALVNGNGMLEVSWLNLLEFSEVTDRGQVLVAEEFLDDLTPEHIGFINVNHDGVIERENKFLRQDRDAVDPHVDYQLLHLFGAHRPPSSLRPISFKGFLTNQNPKVQSLCRTFMEGELASVLEGAREKAKKPPYSSAIKAIPPGHPEVQYLTRYIEIEILRSVVRDEKMRMDSSNWRDMYHTIVPLAYCDFVLLDRGWADRANKAKRRLQKRGHTAKMAAVFWDGTLSDFRNAIERPLPSTTVMQPAIEWPARRRGGLLRSSRRFERRPARAVSSKFFVRE